MDAKTVNDYASKIKVIMEVGVGSGATATAVMAANGRIATGVIAAAGSGYTVDDVLTVATGTGGTFTVTRVGASGEVIGITQLAKGTGYTAVTGAATTVDPSGGTGCTITTTVEKGIASFAVGDGGADYLTADILITGTGSGGGVATAVLVEGAVDDIEVDTAGWYLNTPTIVVTGAPKTGAGLLTHLNAYDLSLRDARLKELIEDAAKTVAVDGTIVNEAIDAL